MQSKRSQPYTSMLRACWTLACIPRLLATHGLHLITGTATSAHGSCKPRVVRLRRNAAHFSPHTRPPDTQQQFSPQYTTSAHALEVGGACLEYQGSLVNTYCTFDLCRPRGRARPTSASCDRRAFALTRSGAGIDLPGFGRGHSNMSDQEDASRTNFPPAEDAWMDMYAHDRDPRDQAIEGSHGG
jgi:hypothetical protein